MGLLSFAFSIGNFFAGLFNNLFLLICDGIYIFISALYQVYEKVASVNLFSRDIFEEITGRMYIVMGIAMLFIFAYNIIMLIINPDDKKGTSGMTKVIKETIISLVLVVLLPLIFNYLFVFQTHILESNIIGNIILGNTGSTSNNSENCDANDYDCTCDFSSYGIDSYNNPDGLKKWAKNSNDSASTILSNLCNDYKKNLTGSQRGAYSIAPTMFSTFYRPTNFDFNDCVNYLQGNDTGVIQNDDDKKICVNYFFDVTASKYSGNITPFFKDKYLKDILSDDKKDNMEFHWLIAIVAGGLTVWMFLCYTMEVGVRVAKLGFFQLISPIPVMLRIIPGQKEKIYKKWFDNLVKTYLDVFIRVAIINFSLLGISLVPTVISTMWTSSTTGDGNFFIKALATVFVILGILKFAQDSPALIKEFFGDAGSFKLRSPAKQIGENKLAKGIASGAGAFTAVSAQNIKSIPKAFNDIKTAEGVKGKLHAFSGSSLNGLRVMGQQYGAAKNGYKYGQSAKDWEQFRKYTYGAAAEQMSKGTLGDKITGFVEAEKTAASNFYKADYEAFDSPAQLAIADRLDEVNKALSNLEKKLDSTNYVTTANSTYDLIKHHINEDMNYRFNQGGVEYYQGDGKDIQETLLALEKYKKELIGNARQAAYKDAIDNKDAEILALGKEYRKALSDNVDAINKANEQCGATGKFKTVVDVDVQFSDTVLSGGDFSVSWKDIREAGSNAGKYSQDIKTNATKKTQIDKDK